MNNKKKLIFLGLDVLVLIVTIGVSLAVFNYTKEGLKTNKVTIGAITMDYQEGNDTISLSNATPMSDEDGKSLNEVGEYFDFTLSTTMSITESVSYEITALKDEEESNLPNEYVRLYLEKKINEDDSYEEVFTPKAYTEIDSENENGTDELGASNKEMLIDSGVISATSTYYYRLRMWVSNTYTDRTEERSFAVKVKAYASSVEINATSGINLTLDGDKINDKTITLQKNALNKKVIAEVLPENAKNKNLIWESSDTSKVKIDSAGNLSLDNIGTSVIRVSTSDKSKSATFTINVVNYNVTGISIPSSVTLVKGNNTTLEAILTPDDAEETTITWSSSSEGIATVTNGYIEAVGVGEAVITATTENGYKATCKVIVTPATLNDIEIKSNPYIENPIVDVGNTLQLEVETTSDNLDKTNIIWESSDNNKAIVSSTGKVTGIAPGTITITAYIKEYPDIKATKTIEVQYPEIKSITMSSDMTINLGNDTTFAIWISPELVRNQNKIHWKSSNEIVTNGDLSSCEGKLTCTITGVSDGSEEPKSTITAVVLDDEGNETSIKASKTLNVNVETILLSTYITDLYHRNDSTLFYDETTDGNLRYTSKNPKNYVWFNNERWRIVGVFNNIKQSAAGTIETRIKIVRASFLDTKYKWDENNQNNWENSTLKSILNSNNAYSYISNNLIDNTYWNLSAVDSSNRTIRNMYSLERGTITAPSGGNYYWIGKVGLLYPSDYLYAGGSRCLDKLVTSGYNGDSSLDIRYCNDTNWLYGEWNLFYFITPSPSDEHQVWWFYGYEYRKGLVYPYATSDREVSVLPSVYLKSNVVVKQDGADGSYDKPYNIELGS